MLVLFEVHRQPRQGCKHVSTLEADQAVSEALTIHNEQATDGRHHQQMDGYDSGLTGDKQIREQWMQADQGWSAACTIHTCSL